MVILLLQSALLALLAFMLGAWLGYALKSLFQLAIFRKIENAPLGSNGPGERSNRGLRPTFRRIGKRPRAMRERGL